MIKWQHLPPELLASWQRHVAKIGPETREAYLGAWTRRSTDGGKTWEKPVKESVSAPHGPIQLQDGRLLYVGLRTFDALPTLGVMESRDDGRSWQNLADIPVAEEDKYESTLSTSTSGDLGYPSSVQLDDGSLLTVYYQIAQPGEKTRLLSTHWKLNQD
jgi:hypothetical protein